MGLTYRLSHDGRLSIAEMDNNFHYIENYLTGLTNSVASLKSIELGLSASLDALAVLEHLDVAGLTASVLGLSSSVTTLTTGLASATASVDTIISDVAGLTASVIGLEDTVLGLGLAATGLSASVDTLISDVAGLTASVIDLQNTFSNITGDFNFLLLVGGVTQSGTFSFTNGILGTYSI